MPLRSGGGRVKRTAREDEDRVAELDDWEMSQVPQVDGMASYTEQREEEREAIDRGEEELDEDDGVDETGKEFAREDGVLFY